MAQKGCSIFDHASPHAIAMAASARLTPNSLAAGNIIGPCMAHWPPPLGTKKFTMPADQYVNIRKVSVEGRVAWVFPDAWKSMEAV